MQFDTYIHGVPVQCKITGFDPFSVILLDRDSDERIYWLEKYIDTEVRNDLLEDFKVLLLAKNHEEMQYCDDYDFS